MVERWMEMAIAGVGAFSVGKYPNDYVSSKPYEGEP